MIKVTHIIKTKAFHSDGRLLKWIKTLLDNDIKSDVIILDDDNRCGNTLEEGVTLTKLSLTSRRYFDKRKGYFLKVPEFFIRLIGPLKKSKSDFLIFQDVQHYLNLLMVLSSHFINGKKVVWDLHELPHPVFFKNSITRKILKYILENVDLAIYTNSERRDYIYKRINMKEKNHFILNNYPDKDYLNCPPNAIPDSLKDLRNGAPYILWLGNGIKQRNFGVFLEAFERISHKYNLVILGNVDSIYKEKIDAFVDSKIVYKAFVKQDDMVSYIDNAVFSVVLYKSDTNNNLYCEPNRLYQLLCRGIPSIVGFNPTMKNIINRYKGGIVLEDDGSSLESLEKAIRKMENPDTFSEIKEHLQNPLIKEQINWNLQFQELVSILKKINQ